MKLILEQWRKYLAEERGPFEHGIYQLFIPRACPGEECRPQKLGTVPQITNGPPSLNKPKGGLWTSTANKAESGAWTSDWNEWMKHDMPHWMNPKGVLLKVNTKNVYHIDTDEDVSNLAEQFPRGEGKEIGRGGFNLGAGPPIDFEAALKKYDGIHWGNYKGQGAVTDFGMENMWDVESTVWRPDAFGNALTEEGVVDVDQRETKGEDETPPWEDKDEAPV